MCFIVSSSSMFDVRYIVSASFSVFRFFRISVRNIVFVEIVFQLYFLFHVSYISLILFNIFHCWGLRSWKYFWLLYIF